MKVSDLKAHPNNPRKVTDTNLDQLKKSMLEHGDLSGIVHNRTTGNTVGGTQRTKNIDKDAEIKITKTFETPTKTGTVALGYILQNGERFSYREVVWDKNRELAANIAANKGAGEWDYQKLTEMLNELDAMNFDLELTMFNEDELARIMGGWDVGTKAAEDVEENTDGITATIKVRCPTEIRDEVSLYLKSKFLEVSFEGIEIV